MRLCTQTDVHFMYIKIAIDWKKFSLRKKKQTGKFCHIIIIEVQLNRKMIVYTKANVLIIKNNNNDRLDSI
jgi:hypothetical protein